jgi:hypothetical protein
MEPGVESLEPGVESLEGGLVERILAFGVCPPKTLPDFAFLLPP